MELDRYDALILRELQKNGRVALVDLADRIGLSPTPCARRVKLLESNGVIEGYTAVLNPSRVGLGLLAVVHVKLIEHSDDAVNRFESELSRLEEVTHCFAMTGAFDFLLQVYAEDLDSLSNVVLKKLLRIPNLRDLQSSVVLETVKRSTSLPLGHLIT